MKKIVLGVATALAALVGLGALKPVLPTPEQLEWADCEVGVIIHQDLQVYEPSYTRHHDTNVPPASVFNPTALNTDQWLETAKAAGAKYAVLVAKHCSGFSLWPTKAHPYSVAGSPWKDGKGDVVADFVASCRKYGIRPGLYASTGSNAYLGICGPKDVPEAKWRNYVEVVKTQLAELWTNYGELFEVWFDGGNLPLDKGGREIEDLLVRLQPKAVVFQGNPERSSCVRWIGNERAHAPEVCWNRVAFGTKSDGTFEATGADYTGSSEGRYWCPGEADMPNRDQNFALQGGWFWRKGDDVHVYPPEELLKRYFTSVGRNCNLLLGMVIDDRGLVPDADVRAFRQFGEMVKELYAHPVARTSGKGKCENRAYIWELEVPASARPNLLSLQEDLTHGENQRTFTLSGFDGTAWHTLVSGYNIGHRRLARFRPGAYVRYRLVLGWPRPGVEPVLRDFALFEEKVCDGLVTRLDVRNVADAELGDLVKARAEHRLTPDDVKSKKYECRFVFRNLNGDRCERVPDVFDAGFATLALDAVDLPAGENELTCVIRRTKETNAIASVTAKFCRAEKPVVRNREVKPGTPVIVRLGTTTVGEVESNPVVFRGVPYVFEHAHWGNLRVRRYPDLSVAVPKLACGLLMPCAFVAQDRVCVTGTRRDREGSHGTYLIESDDLKNWTPAREIVSNLTRIAYNTTMTKADGRYVLATERSPAEGEKVTNGGYQMTFAESTDLKRWRVIPDTAYVHNAGSPCLRFHAGWYYFFSLRVWRHTPEGKPVYGMQVARSRDLKKWEVSEKPVLEPAHEDRRPYPGALFTAAERARLMSAECRNASDIDLCEHNGDLIVTYAWGNQLDACFTALGLVRGMSERAFCESFFGQ